MPHRFDKHSKDKTACANMAHARQWHSALNDELCKIGKRPEPLMNDAIKKAKKYNLIGDKTFAIAHKIRKDGNDARHKF